MDQSVSGPLGGGAVSGRVAVTGASGFIGRVLCRRLMDRGFDVAAVLRRPCAGPWNTTIPAELGHGPFDAASLARVDTIFHLAGIAHVRVRGREALTRYEAVHVHGTRALLQAAHAAGVRCCVLLSSVKAMGEGDDTVWDEETPCRPVDEYGRTKLAAERIVLESGVPCPVVLRPSMVYGSGARGNLSLMIRAVRTGLMPQIRFPRNRRSMIHVEDVVTACLLAASRPAACGRTYILTDGNEYGTNEIMVWIRQALRISARWSMPYAGVRFAAALGDGLEQLGLPAPLSGDRLQKLAGSARYSNSKIVRELGFAPLWDLQRGLAEMVAV